MRILLIMDPGIPVPPPLYGGHERLVYLFATEYQKLGHDVTLLAGPNSYCSGKTVVFGANDLNRSKWARIKEAWFVWKYLYKNKNKFDRIHNFGRLIYLLPVLNYPIKKIMTYGRPVATSGIKIANALPNQNLIFTGCSNYCVSTGNVAGSWKTVYNAIDFSHYKLNEDVSDDAPLMFLGRLDRIKGVHTAIRVAIKTGNQLIIGGNISHTADNYAYFENEIEPQIDGNQIKYLGALTDAEKNIYLGQSKALLFPIEWDEPFGMVMIEAMACGTPVIAFNKGSVPEIIKHGTNGFRCNTQDEMTHLVQQVKKINRFDVRQEAEKRFSGEAIADEYLNL